MSTTRNLLLMGTTLLSLNAQALVCETQMVTKNGKLIDIFQGVGPTKMEACRESRRECALTLRNLQRNGQRQQAKCELVGVVDDHSPIPGPGPGPGPMPPSHDDYALDDLENTLRTGGWRARQYAAIELGKFASVRALELAIDASGDSDSDVRSAASKSVNQIINNIDFSYNSIAIIQSVSPMLKSGSWKKRQTAAIVLGKVQTAEGLIPLIDAMGDSDSDVRSAVAQSINMLKNERDLKQVVKQNLDIIANFASTGSWKKRQTAVQILGQASIPKTISIVVSKMGDSDSDVRSAAVQAFNSIVSAPNFTRVGKRVIEELESLYRSSGWKTRQYAVIALGETMNPYAKPVVLDALDDSDSDVRQAARQAIRKL